MSCFMTIDAAGKPTGFYPFATSDTAPQGAIEISDELHADFVARQFTVHYDTATGALVPDAPNPNAMPILQAALNADIDAQAEAQRLKYITPGAGQAATYLQKQTQAAGALAGLAATPAMTAAQGAAAYVLLAAEIGITVDPSTKAAAVDVFGVARAVAATVTAWLPLAGAIEAVRLKTKAAINAAITVAAAQAAHDAVAWPAPPAA